MFFAAACFSFWASAGAASAQFACRARSDDIPKDSRGSRDFGRNAEYVAVIVKGWPNAGSGTIYRFERENRGSWRQEGRAEILHQRSDGTWLSSAVNGRIMRWTRAKGLDGIFFTTLRRYCSDHAYFKYMPELPRFSHVQGRQR
jgi:hypothetical protein